MIEDYREYMTAPMTHKQASKIAQILWMTLLEAKRALPFLPQTIKSLEMMEAGMTMALYEKLRDVMTEEEYVAEINRILTEAAAQAE